MNEQSTKPLPKVTVKLYSRPDTKEHKISNKKEVVTGRQNAKILAEKVLKKYPQIGPTELAQRAQISKSYASTLLKEKKEGK